MNKKDVILFSPQIETFTPFAGTVDPSRLNMASKQQLQVVIGENTDAPIIIDKNFQKMTKMDSPFAEFAHEDGHIVFSDFETMIIYYPTTKKLITKSIPPHKKLINNSLSLKFKEGVGAVKKGQLLFDYTNMDPVTLLPKIGHRAKILFSSFFGYTSDDAMVVSESFSKKASIEYSQKLFIPVTKEWKFLRNHLDNYIYQLGQVQEEEAFAKYFNIDPGDHFMSEIHNISEQQSMFFTKSVSGIKGGRVVSIKVHQNTEKTFSEMKKEYLYTPGLIEEIESIWLDNQRVLKSTNQVFSQLGIDQIKAQELSQELFESHYSQSKFNKNFETKLKDEFSLDPAAVDYMIEVTVEYKTKTTRGDKFTNVFAGKGVVAMIIPDSLMPIDPDTGDKIDIVFNPLGIFGRNNWGVIFELALSKIVQDIEIQASLIDIDNIDRRIVNGIIERISLVNENFISKYDKEYYDEIKHNLLPSLDSKEDDIILIQFLKSIQDTGFYLYIPNFPKVKYNDFYNDLVAVYAKEFNVNFGKSKVNIDEDLIKWLRDKWHFKNDVFQDEIYSTEIEAFIGSNYMLKLYHTAYSKYTSVSLANSYSKITGQPVRGRKKVGGQHISWQTLAALLGHKENNGILKELYTIKSDAPIKDKEKFLMQYITTGEYHLKPKYISLTKRAVNNALKILGMQFEE